MSNAVWIHLFISLFLTIAPQVGQSSELTFNSEIQTMDVAIGHFKQQKYFKVLKHPITSTGRFFFDKKLGFIWQTNKPIYSAMLLKKGKLLSEDHLGNQEVIQGASALASVLVNVVSGDLDALYLQFDLRDNNQKYCLLLVPTQEIFKRIFKEITLCGQHHIEQLTLYEHSGNYTKIDFSMSKVSELPEAIRARL